MEVESLANLPNPLPLSFRIEGGAWFDLDDADVLDYGHGLDMRAGITLRTVTCRWERRRLRLAERRLVSMARPEIAAVALSIEPVGWSGRIEVRAVLDGGVENGNVDRYAPYPARHLEPPDVATADGVATLRTRLRGTGTGVAVAHRLDGEVRSAGPEPHRRRRRSVQGKGRLVEWERVPIG